MPLPPLLAVAALTAPAPAVERLEVRVDQRFELMSIVFRLAGFREYRMGNVEDYSAAVDAHFGAFQDHPAVEMARSLRKKVGYDAIPNLAVRVQDAQGFRSRSTLQDPTLGLDSRWEPATAGKFLEAMAAFARDTDAEAFFSAQSGFYQRIKQACRTGLLSHLDQPWYQRTFGDRSRDTFTLCIAPLNGGGNYGARVANGHGGQDLFALIGTFPAKPGSDPVFNEAYLPTLVHEFLHAFVNPWVDRHFKQLQPFGEALNAPVIELMRPQAYGTAETALKESLVRAFTIRYFRDHGDPARVEQEQIEQQKRGFYWVEPLEALLGEFTEHRDRWPELESFTPRLLEGFRRWSANASGLAAKNATANQARIEQAYAEGPRLLQLDPPNGAQGVDPASSTLRITFDRPMSGRMAIVQNGDPIPDLQGNGDWDAEGKVLTFKMALKPLTKYRFMLNIEGMLNFRDRAGRPLRPTVVTFTTK